MSRAGIVTVAGKPNAGKSTLLNRLVGEKLAITSPKAQSTRHRVVGLRTEHDTQMVVLDTPGLLDPRDLLHEAMRGAALAAVRDADVVVYLVDAAAIRESTWRQWLQAVSAAAPTTGVEPVGTDGATAGTDVASARAEASGQEPGHTDEKADEETGEDTDEDADEEPEPDIEPGVISPELHEALLAAREARRKARPDARKPAPGASTPHGTDTTPPWPSFVEAAGLERAPRATVLTVLNKCDQLPPDLVSALRTAAPDVVTLSALTGDGVDPLVRAITERLPESPYLYPADEISTLPMRFFCAEFVRETAMEQLGDELPHALACAIDEYREGSSPLYIRAVLYVERESQKAIVIGAGGQQIKKMGRAARVKIEQFVGEPVYLDLWVKVLANWRRKRGAVARLGYGDPSAPRHS